MTAESLQFQSDITSLINELGETLTFSRGDKKLVRIKGAFGKIYNRNINAGSASPIGSEQRVVSIQYTTKYIPELFDVCTDTHKNIYQIVDISPSRFEDTVIAYVLTIT